MVETVNAFILVTAWTWGIWAIVKTLRDKKVEGLEETIEGLEETIEEIKYNFSVERRNNKE